MRTYQAPLPISATVAILALVACGSATPGRGELSVPLRAETAPSSEETNTGSPRLNACVSGKSVACVGPGGCLTNQVCKSDGTGFGPCVCALSAAEVLCVPGQSIACTGVGGCPSSQVCKPDGRGFSACTCLLNGGTMFICTPSEPTPRVGANVTSAPSLTMASASAALRTPTPPLMSCRASEHPSRGHCCSVGLEWETDRCDRPLAKQVPF